MKKRRINIQKYQDAIAIQHRKWYNSLCERVHIKKGKRKYIYAKDY